ncbi:MAG: DUF6455 family protein [Rhodobacteraceae bacterium]|nr:DUF6455 family protein [Paracoccaceae bacterium]
MGAHIMPLGDPNRHFWITRSIARAMDINLSDAMSTNRLTPSDYATMVTRCRMCPHVERCLKWLGESGGAAQAAPEFCANADWLNGLARD